MLRERERLRLQVGKGQREVETESQAGSALSAQSLTWGSNSWTMRSWPDLRSRVGHLTDWATQALPTSSLSILQSMYIWALSILWLLAIVLLSTLGRTCPFETAYLYPLDKYLEVQLLGHREFYFLFFDEPPYCFPEWLHRFAFPPAVQKSSLCPHPPQHLLLPELLILAIPTVS